MVHPRLNAVVIRDERFALFPVRGSLNERNLAFAVQQSFFMVHPRLNAEVRDERFALFPVRGSLNERHLAFAVQPRFFMVHPRLNAVVRDERFALFPVRGSLNERHLAFAVQPRFFYGPSSLERCAFRLGCAIKKPPLAEVFFICGKRGIRTPDTVARIRAFQARPFGRSGIFPLRGCKVNPLSEKSVGRSAS